MNTHEGRMRPGAVGASLIHTPSSIEELLEVIRGVDAAMLTPQSPATTEQLAARRRAYVENRMALGC